VEPIDLREVERELCRLPEVNAARIVEDEIGRPVEVHILAARSKHAKQIVRDVQSVAMAEYGLELDRRLISVVQLEGGAGDGHVTAGEPVGTARVHVEGITAEKQGMRSVVRVTLSRDDMHTTGIAEGSVASSTRHRLVAQATLEALRQLVPSAECTDVEEAAVTRIGQRDVAIASVVFVVPPVEDVIAGSALVRAGGEQDAMVRAVLDATNRRLTRL
jgi:hypothetical protein